MDTKIFNLKFNYLVALNLSSLINCGLRVHLFSKLIIQVSVKYLTAIYLLIFVTG